MSRSYLPVSTSFLVVVLLILTTQLCICDPSYTTSSTTPPKYDHKPPTPFHYNPRHQQQKSLLPDSPSGLGPVEDPPSGQHGRMPPPA